MHSKLQNAINGLLKVISTKCTLYVYTYRLHIIIKIRPINTYVFFKSSMLVSFIIIVKVFHLIRLISQGRDLCTFGQLVVSSFHLRKIAFAQLPTQLVQTDPFSHGRIGLPFPIVV